MLTMPGSQQDQGPLQTPRGNESPTYQQPPADVYQPLVSPPAQQPGQPGLPVAGGENMGGQGIPPAPFPQQGLGTGNAPGGQTGQTPGMDIGALLQQLFGGQMQGGMQNASPMQPFYIPQPTQGQATLMQGANAGPAAQIGAVPQAQTSQMQAAHANGPTGISGDLFNSLGPDASIAQLLKGFAPQAQQSTNALNNQLAAMGITGGAALNAQDQLQGQLAASLAPELSNVIGRSQGMQLGAGEFGTSNALQQALQNAGFQQGASQFNAGAQNQGSQFNVNNMLSALFGNQSATNNMSQFNAGLQQQAGSNNQNAMNGMTMQNLSNLNNTNLENTNIANTAQMQLAQMLQQAYGQEFGAFNNLNSMGLGQAGSLSQGALSGLGGIAQNQANQYGISQGLMPIINAAAGMGGGG